MRPGNIVDEQGLYEYVEEAEPLPSGGRRVTVRAMDTGEVFTAGYYAIKHNQTFPPSVKAQHKREADEKKSKYKVGDIIGKHNSIKILSLDKELYPPHRRADGRTDKCGLFLDLDSGEEFVGILNRVMYSPGSRRTISTGEQALEKAFQELGIDVESQHVFDTCLGYTTYGKDLAFDFYIPQENMVIEYDGTQHMLPYDHDDEEICKSIAWTRDDDERYKAWGRDIIKEAWCNANDIFLVRLAAVMPSYINSSYLSDVIEQARKAQANGETMLILPSSQSVNYESVHNVMFGLPLELQEVLADRLVHTSPEYRRENDLPIGEDSELEAALPLDGTEPMFQGEKHASERRVRGQYVKGDIVGPNRVRYISDYDENGNLILPQGKLRRAMFECSCEDKTHFIATFSSVKGYPTIDYKGKMCEKCLKARHEQVLIERKKHNKLEYSVGDPIDPDGNFLFAGEIEENALNNDRWVYVIEPDYPDVKIKARLNNVRTGRILTMKEKEQNKRERSYRKISKGDIIGIKKNLEVQEDVEYYTTDDYSNIRIKVKNLDNGNSFTVKYLTLRSYSPTGECLIDYEEGDVVTDDGVQFVYWCDEHGKAVELDGNKRIAEYARFRCGCEQQSEFIAKWDSVRFNNKRCTHCMEERQREMRRKIGLSKRLQLESGDVIDPDGEYIYIGEDEKAITKKRKIIIQSIATGEQFSYRFDRVRQGDIIPPSAAKKNIRNGHDTNQKYKKGDIIDNKKGRYCIVGELEAEINSLGNPVRKFVFQNLSTGYLFDTVMQSVRSGAVTGARSKKTRSDYPDVALLSEEEVKEAVRKGNQPSREKKSGMVLLNEIGEEKIQAMLNEGKSSTQIGKEIGVAFQTVCKYIKKHGLSNPNTNDSCKVDVSSMPLDEIKERLDNGQSMTSIGKELGYSYAWMKKAVENIRN